MFVCYFQFQLVDLVNWYCQELYVCVLLSVPVGRLG